MASETAYKREDKTEIKNMTTIKGAEVSKETLHTIKHET